MLNDVGMKVIVDNRKRREIERNLAHAVDLPENDSSPVSDFAVTDGNAQVLR
jgi:hypothetical protein